MKQAIVLYLHAHQPYRVRPYGIFDVAERHDYFDDEGQRDTNNRRVLEKVVAKSYMPTNAMLLRLLERYPEFRISLSITGTLLEQLEKWSPQTLKSFQELIATGRVELVGETYHHSLAFFYSLAEFETQLTMHADKLYQLFGVRPTSFRGTELAYNNDVAVWAERQGYKAVLAEGWDKVLGWRSANYVYRPKGTQNIRLLTKNYRLSDDIAFRFSDRTWSEWPMTAEKFVHWVRSIDDKATNYNLFMDYETFGEHQWAESGIFEFLHKLPEEWLKFENTTFATVSEIAESEPVDEIDAPETITWADTERDLSAWLGNDMQQEAINLVYKLHGLVLQTGDWALIEDWRRLTTSDHFYYMCTKWFSDGDIHAYFSPYESPYEAFIAYMNVIRDMKVRLLEKGVDITCLDQ